MRTINKIIVHCTDTKPNVDWHASDIDNCHKKKGWTGIGYHFVVCRDGSIELGRPVSKIGAHCKGQNETSIGVCYVGGQDDKGNHSDTRTTAQKHALLQLLQNLTNKYHCPIYGHRDFARRDCPCFDAHVEYKFMFDALLRQQRKEIDDVFPPKQQS